MNKLKVVYTSFPWKLKYVVYSQKLDLCIKNLRSIKQKTKYK